MTNTSIKIFLSKLDHLFGNVFKYEFMYWKFKEEQLAISDNLTLEVAGDTTVANVVGLEVYSDYSIMVGIGQISGQNDK